MAKPVVKASNFKNLTLRDLVTIASRHGLEPRDSDVLANAKAADELHGVLSTGADWSTGGTGFIQADLLLNGYLSDQASCARAEAGAARQFERDAYGEAA